MKLSYRTRQILLLMKNEDERGLGWIASHLRPPMLYPNLHPKINEMEFRDGLIMTLKKYSNGTRLLVLTSKGKKIAKELKE